MVIQQGCGSRDFKIQKGSLESSSREVSLYKVLRTNEFRGICVSGLDPLMLLIQVVDAGNHQDNPRPLGSLLLYHILYKIFSASFRMSASIKRFLAFRARRSPAAAANLEPSPSSLALHTWNLHCSQAGPGTLLSHQGRHSGHPRLSEGPWC